MAENNDSSSLTLDEALDGRQRVRAMLMAKGHTIASWSRARKIEHDQQVHMMLSGHRPYPEIRDMLAEDLGITRETLDQWIPLEAA